MKLSYCRRVCISLACLSMCAAWPVAAQNAAEAPAAAPPSASVSTPPAQAATAPAATPAADSSVSTSTVYIVIPGPLRSFLRMSGISQKASPEEVLPLLGHFVETYGYEGSKEKSPKAAEALVLFRRYFQQAKALALLAGPDQSLHFANCDESKPLLLVLGYKLRNGCGDPALEVDDQEKAFVTVDSGFPLVDLEQALLDKKSFSTPYVSSRVPLIYTKRDWTGKEDSKDTEVVEALADNPALARLYWGLSRVDNGTRAELRKAEPVQRMVAQGSAMDFYGSNIAVRNGHVLVPGGPAAEPAWRTLVGGDPANAGDFVVRLLQKDGGSLAEYYDSIARAPLAQQTYFTASSRLTRFYTAFHGNDSSGDAVRSIFRPGADLLLLTTRVPLENGEPLVPGNLAAWKDSFHRKNATKAERQWAGKTGHWSGPDDLMEGLFALARTNYLISSLQMYLTLSEIDRRRDPAHRMSPETVQTLISHFSKLRDQYQIFAEFSGLDDASMREFVKMTEKFDGMRDPLVRGDAMGIFEANIGLWQIFARQGQIPATELNTSWRKTIEPFGPVGNSTQAFDAGRASLAEVVRAVTGKPDASQNRIIDLLAGPDQTNAIAQQVHQRMATRIQLVLANQRLVSLDTLNQLGDDFSKKTQPGATVDTQGAAQLAEELEEARSPRAMFTEAERAEWAPGHEPNRHIVAEMRTDLKKSLAGPLNGEAPAALRGELSPFLRDTLVGLNYAYYDPPGGQVLQNSPQLIRSHDFLSSESVGESRAWRAPEMFGVGQAAAQGTHLSGSLAGLPYALSEMEQDFVVPENVQALIWHDTAADLLTTGVVPRWWSTPEEALHAAALYQKTGEELLNASAKDENLRADVLTILSDRLPPGTLDQISNELTAGNPEATLAHIAPADSFYLAAEFRKRFPTRSGAWGAAGNELTALAEKDAQMADPGRLAQEFGMPHPMLAESYNQELLNLKPFPSLMDYASELLAESWESTNLYWARLADEMGYSPVMLNELAPALTRRMVEKIFGSDFDDWPALIRAMRETGDEFRRGEVAGLPKANAAFVP